jgi:AbrB family looped-hinge helix DNA binding protein
MRVTEKGQVTIPKEVRDRLGIIPGSEVEFVTDDKGARLVLISGQAKPDPENFEAWLKSVGGSFDTNGMTADEYMDWLRGPRDDLGAR